MADLSAWDANNNEYDIDADGDVRMAYRRGGLGHDLVVFALPVSAARTYPIDTDPRLDLSGAATDDPGTDANER